MLKLNKKQVKSAFFGLITLASVLFFFNIKESQASGLVFNQVKTPNSSTVYYIHQATLQRKAYINEAVFLDYGNSWDEVKVISPEVLDRYIDARLLKTENSDELYYINMREGGRIKMNSLEDILKYNLENVLPITVSQFELEQYQLEDSYLSAGLEKEAGLSLALAPLVIDNNGQVFVPGTKNNALLSFSLGASQKSAIIQSITFKLSGLYSSELIDKASLVNVKTGEKIKSSSSFRDRQVTIRFNNDSLVVPANQTLTFELRLDFNQVAQVHNQNIKASLESVAAIEANLIAQGSFPLLGLEFKFLEASNILAEVIAEEQSLGNEGSKQRLGLFTITETSGQEDVYIRELVFINQGSASSRDLEAFRLRRDNQVVSAAPKMISNRIVFPVNYLRVPKGTSITVSVSANYALDYQADRSVNLSLEQADIEGASYSLFLAVDIINLDESFILR